MSEAFRSQEVRQPKVIIDITRPFSPQTIPYPNTPSVVFHSYRKEGSWAQMVVVEALTHSGTHWDAESHLGHGGKTITDYPVDTFVGSCVVIDISGREEGGVVPEDFEGKVHAGDRVLFKTRNSKRGFEIWDPNYAGITGVAAKRLQKLGVVAVGIDALSIKQPGEDNTAHEVLLTNGIPILEGIDLSQAEEGKYFLDAAPIPYTGLDGAPASAKLMRF